MIRTAPAGTGLRAGFTLVELLCVVVILAVVTSAAIPSFARMRETATLRAGARSVAAACGYARSLAVSHQREARVVIRAAGAGCRVELAPETGTNSPAAAAPGQAGFVPSLPTGVALVSDPVVHPEAGFLKEGEHLAVRFHPDGSSSGGSISVQRGERLRLRLTIDRITGRVKAQPASSEGGA